jgi:hypothetical protein
LRRSSNGYTSEPWSSLRVSQRRLIEAAAALQRGADTTEVQPALQTSEHCRSGSVAARVPPLARCRAAIRQGGGRFLPQPRHSPLLTKTRAERPWRARRRGPQRDCARAPTYFGSRVDTRVKPPRPDLVASAIVPAPGGLQLFHNSISGRPTAMTGDSRRARKSRTRFYLAFPRGEVAEKLKAAVCKAAMNYRTGLRSMISGPFVIGTLVGAGCRRMVVGPR